MDHMKSDYQTKDVEGLADVLYDKGPFEVVDVGVERGLTPTQLRYWFRNMSFYPSDLLYDYLNVMYRYHVVQVLGKPDPKASI